MTTDTLSTTFAALADPTRRAILARLAAGEATVTELAEPFEMSLPAVSKHLKVLERAGLIERGRSAQRRPARLRADRLQEVDEWLERYRRLWEERFERLDEYLEEIQAQTPDDALETDEPRAAESGAGERPQAHRGRTREPGLPRSTRPTSPPAPPAGNHPAADGPDRCTVKERHR